MSCPNCPCPDCRPVVVTVRTADTTFYFQPDATMGCNCPVNTVCHNAICPRAIKVTC